MSTDRTSSPASLDFWLGEWSCTWDGGQAEGRGMNRIVKELEGHVVVERFESFAPERWSGMSLSVFDGRARRWRQTWVDSTGNYWAFREGRDGDHLTFQATDVEATAIEASGTGVRREVLKRMVFFDIGSDAFRWRWERSLDGSATWEPLWIIDYRRVTPG
jgi:hypothetical protein